MFIPGFRLANSQAKAKASPEAPALWQRQALALAIIFSTYGIALYQSW